MNGSPLYSQSDSLDFSHSIYFTIYFKKVLTTPIRDVNILKDNIRKVRKFKDNIRKVRQFQDNLRRLRQSKTIQDKLASPLP